MDIYKLGSRALLILVVFLVCLWMISGARANTITIKDINVNKANEDKKIEFILSNTIKKDAVDVNLDRNFIQVSMHGVNAFPAINRSISDSILSKIFAYQYQPDLARVRILLNEKSEKFKDKIAWNVEANKVSLQLDASPKDQLTTKAAAQVKNTDNLDAKEAELLKKVTATNTNDIPKVVSDSEAQELFKQPEEKEKTANAADTVRQKSDDPAAAVRKMAINLLLVLSAIGIVALVVRKFVLGKNVLGIAKNKQIINMVSNYSVGPKKSITLVKVADQYMVLGIAGDNINLIAKLGPEANIDRYLDSTDSDDSFKGILHKTVQIQEDAENSTINNIKETISDTSSAVKTGMRSLIKKRLENFKPL